MAKNNKIAINFRFQEVTYDFLDKGILHVNQLLLTLNKLSNVNLQIN
ncbi:hypothetical protein IQ247_07850 [Plectonema cf. radiosum LEGE 06105]|uniref:Uncharacterized protein n=1 Tax=Plectonema cf. radiosum LEGE 06105 TaxID=945769 RepID=A0A8J7F3L4_9CYAN|nr:hypothetical protein [Plectonema radiosum]MBE9212630.1 hypothetical protein [Plectonema cf. radiosum LEGE 06105]